MSAWILSLLPLGVFLFLLIFRGSYVEPLHSELIGIVMTIAGAVWLAIGVFIITRIIKVEV